MPKQAKILIIDDDPVIRDACEQVLLKENYSVISEITGEEGLAQIKKEIFDVILLDLKLPGISGLEVLKALREDGCNAAVIIITGYSSVESAVEAMKLGSFDYITKPFGIEELRVIVKKALANRKLFLENIYLRNELEIKSEFEFIVGSGPAMINVMELIEKVSGTDSTVLITGESGTGKELIARKLHQRSLRKDQHFVVVDCGALVETLFESELFGHEKGSFTGAIVSKYGRFEIADKGTLFLDEISNISLNMQAKLLRAIQQREITRIGSSRIIKVDVRIISCYK